MRWAIVRQQFDEIKDPDFTPGLLIFSITNQVDSV